MSANDYCLVVALLAAGKSERFKGVKMLARADDDYSLLEKSWHAIRTAMTQSGFSDQQITIATGESHHQLKQQMPISMPLYYCSDAYLGMGHSIAQISQHIITSKPDCSHLMIALADQIALEAQDFARLISVSTKEPEQIICTGFAGEISAPAIFPKHYFTQLLQLNGDKGAKPIMLQNKNNLSIVQLNNAAIDIDTQQDLHVWQCQTTT